MESLSRVILFLTSYFIVLALSFSINTESEYLQSGLFLVISIIIASWLYYLHFKKKEVQEFQKEVLFVMFFLCIVTSTWSFKLNYFHMYD